MKKKLNDFLDALAFLTVIPVPTRAEWKDRGKLFWFPVVGLMIGGMLLVVDSAAALFLDTPVRDFIDIVFLIIITGGLHLDGLADSGDGLFSHKNREETLAIMKDSRTGVFGILSLFVVLGAKWAGLCSLQGGERRLYLFFIPGFSRSAMVIAMAFMEYVGGEKGIARELLCGNKDKKTALGAAFIPVAALLLFSFRTGIRFILITLVIGLLWTWHCKRKIGGMTGDTLGALCEIAEALLFIG